MCSFNAMDCRVISKRIKHIDIRLFEEEIDVVDFLCFYYDISYEQLLVKLAKEHAEHTFAHNKNYKYNL